MLKAAKQGSKSIEPKPIKPGQYLLSEAHVFKLVGIAYRNVEGIAWKASEVYEWLALRPR